MTFVAVDIEYIKLFYAVCIGVIVLLLLVPLGGMIFKQRIIDRLCWYIEVEQFAEGYHYGKTWLLVNVNWNMVGSRKYREDIAKKCPATKTISKSKATDYDKGVKVAMRTFIDKPKVINPSHQDIKVITDIIQSR